MAPLHGRGLVAMRVTMVMTVVPVRYPRILAEDEGLDGHRHRVRRHADAAQIDEVEVTQRDAVDHQDLRGDAPLFLEERAEGLRDVAIENDVEGFPPFDRTGKAKRDRARECRHALERRRPAPAKRQRDLGIALDDVERLEVAGDGGGESFGLELALEANWGLEHLEILSRQQLARLRDVHRVAGELDAV